MSKDIFINEIKTFPVKEPYKYRATLVGSNILITMYREGREVASLTCTPENTDLWFALGKTHLQYRRLGYGTWIRAIAVWCAKRAGYKKIYQTSTRMPNSPWTPRPTSAYIMNKLGFKHWKNNKIDESNRESRVLNLTQNIPLVNSIIRNLRM
jgi:hypothetical protein